MLNQLWWIAAFFAAVVALCYSVHLEFHNYQHRVFGFEINSNRRFVAFVILAVGAFCLFAPITWTQCFSTDLGEGWNLGPFSYINWAITNLFTVGWTTTIQTGLTDVTSTVYGAAQTGNGLLTQMLDLAYSVLALAYIVALPAEVGLFAFNAVTTRLAGSTIKRHLKHADHAIIFDGINANVELLARDIIRRIKEGTLSKANGNGKVSLVFCLGEDEDGDRKQTLRNLCQGFASYVFSDDDAADILSTIVADPNCIRRAPAIDVIAACEQTEHNVSATIDMLQALHQEPSCSDGKLKITLHCIHDNPDDAQIFDAVKQQAKKNQGKEPKNENIQDEKPKGEPIGLHLISRVQDEVYDVLAEAPLYNVLDRIDLSVDRDPEPQNLTVLVIGAGEYGMQAARTVYWMGRMPSVKLNIVVVDPDARTILEHEAARYPEMLGEVKDVEPTVHFVEAAAPSLALDRLMAGECVPALHFDAQNKCVAADDEAVLLPDDARIYAFVTTGDCSRNLSCSLMLQRQIFNRYVDQGHPDYAEHQPVICPHIESKEILNALQSLDKTKGKDNIAASIMHPFGSRRAFYTYANIIDDEREVAAIQLNAAYELCYGDAIKKDFNTTLPAEEAREKYNAKESNKSSSRASAAHIPYHFWALGFTDSEIENPAFEREWEERLLPTVKTDIIKDFFSAANMCATKEEFEAKEQENREQFELVCRLGDMEHDRWLAYCQATGMTELGHGTAEQEREQRRRTEIIDALLSGKSPSGKHEGVRKSDILMRHAFMTPDNDALGTRGFLLDRDVFAYDRAIIALSARIAKGDIAK